MSFTHANALDAFGVTPLIVATSAANGSHTTLAGALAAAVSGQTVFLRDSVTENVTLPAGVNIASWSGSSANTSSITGKITMTAAGTSSISGIELITNSDFCVAVTGSAASILNINNCYINAVQNTAISFSSSSGSAQINLNNCTGNLATTGIAYFASSSAGIISFNNCNFTNTGSSVTASTISAGTLNMNSTVFTNTVTTSGTGGFNLFYTQLGTSGLNAIAVNHGSTTNSRIEYCDLIGNTSAAINIGAGSTVVCPFALLNSSAANAVTGTGTFQFGYLDCLVTNTLASGLTLNNTDVAVVKALQFAGPTGTGGTAVSNLMGFYEEGTFTPTLDGSVSGTTTYTVQAGFYTKIGNLVTIQAQIAFSAATGTGNVTLGGFPFTIKNQANYIPVGTWQRNNATSWGFPASTTYGIVKGTLNTTTAVVSYTGSAANAANLQMANATLTCYYTLTYQV